MGNFIVCEENEFEPSKNKVFVVHDEIRERLPSIINDKVRRSDRS